MNPFRLTRVLRPVLVRILGCLSETMAQVSLEPRSEAKCRNHGNAPDDLQDGCIVCQERLGTLSEHRRRAGQWIG